MSDGAAWLEIARMAARALVVIGIYQFGRWMQRRDDRAARRVSREDEQR